ncbi:hypothetical protein Hanom_Chr10g00886071 [Helianthus anomalus]
MEVYKVSPRKLISFSILSIQSLTGFCCFIANNLWVRFIHVKMVVSILENLKEVLNMGLGLAHYHFR